MARDAPVFPAPLRGQRQPRLACPPWLWFGVEKGPRYGGNRRPIETPWTGVHNGFLKVEGGSSASSPTKPPSAVKKRHDLFAATGGLLGQIVFGSHFGADLHSSGKSGIMPPQTVLAPVWISEFQIILPAVA